MGSSAEIYIKHRSGAAEVELVREYMEIVAPLGYDADADGDHGVYMVHKDNSDKEGNLHDRALPP